MMEFKISKSKEYGSMDTNTGVDSSPIKSINPIHPTTPGLLYIFCNSTALEQMLNILTIAYNNFSHPSICRGTDPKYLQVFQEKPYSNNITLDSSLLILDKRKSLPLSFWAEPSKKDNKLSK